MKRTLQVLANLRGKLAQSITLSQESTAGVVGIADSITVGMLAIVNKNANGARTVTINAVTQVAAIITAAIQVTAKSAFVRS
jgi:hypothetical protein